VRILPLLPIERALTWAARRTQRAEIHGRHRSCSDVGKEAMCMRTNRWNRMLVLGVGVVVAVAGSAVSAASASAQTTMMSGPSGSYFYQTYCAVCHGPNAKGDGPLADSMRRRPPDLTEIAKREKGVFPADKVFRIIDGRQRVPGHGGPDMPVWGDAFRRAIEGGDEKAVETRIQAIVDYLATLQPRGVN
jgi:mono/diheme cytochrome c family protein